MKRIIFSCIVLFLSQNITAQLDATTEKALKNRKAGNTSKDTTWKVGGLVNVNFSQVYLSNWAGGGQNSISTQGILSLYANCADGKYSWDNSLDLAYGVIKQGDAKSTPWFKNDDRIELNSKYGRLASKKWYYSALFNFRTQFTNGYANAGDTVHISNFLAPAYTIVALGMDYKPNKNFTVFVSPLTSKMTFVMDGYLSSIGAFGIVAGANYRSEVGGYFKLGWTREKPLKMEGVTFKTNVTLFSNYQNKPQNIDVTWETLTNIKLNKYLTMSLSTYMIYDHDIDIARFNSDGSSKYLQNSNGDNYVASDGSFIQKTGPVTQFKEAWAVGFAYKF